MSSKNRRPQALPSPKHGLVGGARAVLATVERVGSDGIRLDFVQGERPRAERVFAADGGYAQLKHGYPELRFGQLDAGDETKLSRILVVRYDPITFQERARGNEPFRLDVKRWLRDEGDSADGLFSRLISQASQAGVPSAIVDAEAEMMARVNHSAGITFLSSSHFDRHALVSGQTKSIVVDASIEVTMRLRAFVDLLDSWAAVVEELT